MQFDFWSKIQQAFPGVCIANEITYMNASGMLRVQLSRFCSEIIY